MNRLLLIGLNHTTAPLVVRERLAFAPQRMLEAIDRLRRCIADTEAVILSTCNRVELYLAAPSEIDRQTLVRYLADFHNVPAEAFQSHLYEIRGRGVIEHLFAVASSLDSMVLGETQILGQVRSAYELSRNAGATGPSLNPLFQKAVSVGKDVLAGGLGEGRISVSSVAVDYARRIFDHFADKKVLCIGTGKMSRLVLQHFVSLNVGELLVCSRDQSRADATARDFKGRGVAFDAIEEHLVASDIVISSTGAPHPIITKKTFAKLMKQRRYRPIFLIDIAVPRDVEPAVAELENVYLYNLDDLQEVVTQTTTQRSQQAESAAVVVRQQVDAYLQWHRQREIGPMIEALYNRYNTIARAELERTLGKLPLDDAGKQQLEELVHRIVQKMLHDPVSRLRQSHDPRDDAGGPAYTHAIEQLFKITPHTPQEQPRDGEDA